MLVIACGKFWNEWFAVTACKGGSPRVSRCTIFVHLLMYTARRYASFAAMVGQLSFATD
jgi:hypothetical protein